MSRARLHSVFRERPPACRITTPQHVQIEERDDGYVAAIGIVSSSEPEPILHLREPLPSRCCCSISTRRTRRHRPVSKTTAAASCWHAPSQSLAEPVRPVGYVRTPGLVATTPHDVHHVTLDVSSHPCRITNRTSPARLVMPSFCMMRVLWLSTVFTVMPSDEAISLFV